MKGRLAWSNDVSKFDTFNRIWHYFDKSKNVKGLSKSKGLLKEIEGVGKDKRSQVQNQDFLFRKMCKELLENILFPTCIFFQKWERNYLFSHHFSDPKLTKKWIFIIGVSIFCIICTLKLSKKIYCFLYIIHMGIDLGKKSVYVD